MSSYKIKHSGFEKQSNEQPKEQYWGRCSAIEVLDSIPNMKNNVAEGIDISQYIQ